MIPETSVNWQAFAYKFADNPQRAFENLTYYLFCDEFGQKHGIFRYFNQPHIETNPIAVKGGLIGFQAKYYSESVAMSSKEQELREAVQGAARSYPGITMIYFYISREFTASSKKGIVKPAYQTNIENVAQKLGIEIVWRAPSHIEAQLMQDHHLTACRNVFFQVDSAIQTCCENLRKHRDDIFQHINTSVRYKDHQIVLENENFVLADFLKSRNQVLLVIGDAGSGKSAWVKNLLAHIEEDSVLLAFKCTDMDVEDKLSFLRLYGMLALDEMLRVYENAKERILYIDAVEKYFILENQESFDDILQAFLDAGWKIVFTIRSAYKESFQNLLLANVKVESYHVDLISFEKLTELADTYGFKIPQDKNLCGLLRVPFYLGLYLALDDIEDEKLLTLNKAAFRSKIWADIIRNNKKRKDNMPARREQVIVSMTMDMLQKEQYQYLVAAEDDYEAFSKLEQSGVIIQSEDATRYFHSHDVFEEMVAGHIFDRQYEKGVGADEFFVPFRTSLRTRKLFRGWLAEITVDESHADIIFEMLASKRVDKIWKDEILLTVISTERLKSVYHKLFPKMSENNYEMLRTIIFLINTCCRAADYTRVPLKSGKLLPFRLSKPSGYAWESLFVFLDTQKEVMVWDKELISIVIDILDSWTKHKENAKTENTQTAGSIGLFLFEKLSNDEDFRYCLRDEQIEKLQDVLLHAAWMIPNDLGRIFQCVMDGIQVRKREGSFGSFSGRGKSTAPDMYVDLAERAISNIYNFGNVPSAMPQMTIQLMEKLWIRPTGVLRSSSGVDLDGDFGLNSHLSSNYYPASAYQTPIINLLKYNSDIATDFMIDFCNKVGEMYANSHLNKDYRECEKIHLVIGKYSFEQTASARLWQLYRGTHVGPDVLVSLLMGYEAWLLAVVTNTDANVVTAYFRYVLMKSKNVMLTSIVVSVAQAYPEKMFDIVCDLLKTKEIFRLDSKRVVSEHSVPTFLLMDAKFKDERMESDKLPHRKVRLEDVILRYQTNQGELSDEQFQIRREKLFKAMDEAIKDIDAWDTEDKYAYYKMDIRKYREIEAVKSDGNGNQIYTVVPEFSEDMKVLSKKSREKSDAYYKYLQLQLWSIAKFNGDRQYEKYVKYADTAVAYEELRELWSVLCTVGMSDEGDDGESELNLSIFQSIATVSYTSAVLLRDFGPELSEDAQILCTNVIFEIGNWFAGVSEIEVMQVGNGAEAIVTGLLLLLNEREPELVKKENLFCLALKILLKDWRHNSVLIKSAANTIWKYCTQDAWRFIYLFVLVGEKYEQERIAYRRSSGEDFWENFWKNEQETVDEVLKLERVGVSAIDFSKISKRTMFTVMEFVSPARKEAFVVAWETRDAAMGFVFSERRRREESERHLTGYEIEYLRWLADVLLYCTDSERKLLVDFFLEKTNLSKADNIEEFLKFMIQEQEFHRKTIEFWQVWERMKPEMIALGNGKEPYHYSDSNAPVGNDRILAAYLFANSRWNPDVHRCDVLSEERAVFFSDFVEKSKNVKAMFYALGRLLHTVGRDAYREVGMDWLYKLVLKDSEGIMRLYDNSLYWMEEYVGTFVDRHRMEFRGDVRMMRKVQDVLEYMIGQGSSIAFFLREEI